MMNTKTFWEKYYLHSLAFCVFVFLIYTFWFYTSFFYSSILNYSWVSSDPFDGTVYPIEYIPNPIELTYEQRKQKFEEIDSKYFIKTPHYNPSIFWKDLELLSTWSPEYKDVITQKVLYTVPYMSTYNFDYKEYSWSHPGIDIVVPEWTPVKNIANGFVIDTWYQPSGFWYYVLVKHSDVSYAWKTQTFYSLYAHLSKITIDHGIKISKGTQVWLVWESWTATVPHLHFQIDISTAPYSPFWPFSTADMKKAGVWFFEAINIWLGKESALMYTINPLKFVNDTFNNVFYTNTTEPQKTPESIQEEIIPPLWDNQNISLPTISDPIIAEDTLNNVPQEENKSENDNKTLVVKKEDMLNYEVELLSAIDIDDIVLNDNPNFNTFKDTSFDTSKEDTSSSISSPIIDKQDEDIWNQTWNDIEFEAINESIFSDINNTHKYYTELKYFKDNNIISWFSDGSFKPKNNITRVEALKIILLANNITPINDAQSKFKDILTNSWENTYVNAGIEQGIISVGNIYFSPLRNFSRVEALKLILTLGKVNIELWEWTLEIEDVSEEDWYYNYVNYAVKNNLIEMENGLFEPNKPISREELVSILYKYIQK